MAETNAFRGVINFMLDMGVYDVILPFLLIFTIVFAILEKTKILGVEKVGDKETTKKNINSIVAVIVAFLIIASTKLVAVINEVMANVILLLLLGVCFLLLVGVFFNDKEFSLEKYPRWISFFMIMMFIGIVLIFLNALGWLEALFGLTSSLSGDWETPTAFILVLLFFIWYITRTPEEKKKSEKKD